jgi:hypothetical protein
MERAEDQAVYSLCKQLREIGAITVKKEPGNWREEIHVIASIGVVSEAFAKAAVWNSGLEWAAAMLESERSKYTLAKRWKGKRDLLEVLIAMFRAHKAKLKEGNRHAD